MLRTFHDFPSPKGSFSAVKFVDGQYSMFVVPEMQNQFSERIMEFTGRFRMPDEWHRADIRSNNARQLFTIKPPDTGKLFVKSFMSPRGLQKLRFAFESSKPLQEFETLIRLREAGIPAPSPVAVIEKRSGWFLEESILYLEFMPGVLTLNEYIASTKPDISIYRRLANSCGRLASDLVTNGFLHRDFHIGNILMDGGGPDSKMLISDLHRAVWKKAISPAEVVEMAGFMLYSLRGPFSRTSRLCFIRTFHEGCANVVSKQFPDFKSFARAVSAAADRRRNRHVLSRMKRSVTNSTKFKAVSTIGYSIYSKKTTTDKFVMNIIEKHDHLKDNAPMKLEKNTQKRAISIIQEKGPGGTVDKFYVKEYLYTTVQILFKNFFRPHKARSAWMSGEAFAVLGLPTPEPVALVEKRFLFFITSACLITHAIPDAIPLSSFVVENFSRHFFKYELRQHKDQFTDKVLSALVRIHSLGVFHHDMKANNILVKKGRTTSDITLYWLDLDDVDYSASLRPSRAIKNLAQLSAATPSAITAADRLRCFLEYNRRTRMFKDRDSALSQIMRITIDRNHVWP